MLTTMRRHFDEEMLDLDKATFTETMNFRIKVPKLIMKLSNTYYAKLSKITTMILNKNGGT